MTMTNEDGSQLRRELVVAVLGILIGVLTTFFNKILETEYLYQRNLKVLEYSDKCHNVESTSAGSLTVCTLNLTARGLKPTKKIRVSVTAQSSGNEDIAASVETKGLILAPSFAPPDLQIDTNAVEKGFAAIELPILKAGQSLQWTVEVKTRKNINLDTQILRTVSTDDESALIEQGSIWRWERWTTLALLSMLVPLVVVILLLLVRVSLRPKTEPHAAAFE